MTTFSSPLTTYNRLGGKLSGSKIKRSILVNLKYEVTNIQISEIKDGNTVMIYINKLHENTV